MKHASRKLPSGRFVLGCALAAFVGGVETTWATEPAPADAPAEKSGVEWLQKLLPVAWQSRPEIRFNAFTEMTTEGRKWRVPTPENPMRYVANPAQFAVTGWAIERTGKHPPASDVQEAMRKALAANGYLPVANPGERPEIVVFIAFGSSATDPTALASDSEIDQAPHMAGDLVKFVLRDPKLFRDVYERARFVAGEQFAHELKLAIEAEGHNMAANAAAARVPGDRPLFLPVTPEFGSPFEMFLRSGKGVQMEHLAEMAFHTLYYAMASAYDFSAAEKGKKILLWRTRMTVGADGVDINEAIRPLIAVTGSYLGRETTEAAVIERRLNREGRVEIGTATVVEEPKPAPVPAEKSNPR